LTSVASPWVRQMHDSDEAVVAGHREDALREAGRYRGRLMKPESVDSDSHGLGLVSGVGSTVMGSLVGVHRSDSEWFIVHVHVQPDARGVGLGDLMLSEFLSLIAARGATWCGAQALPGDRETKNLFERHGLVAQTIVVGRDLSARTSGADASR
jgi:ribosomal protein S18 acetylase RimI-like enzyme